MIGPLLISTVAHGMAASHAAAEQNRLLGLSMAFQRANAGMMIDLGLPLYALSENAPCSYCGRTRQAAKHKSCDGCGAPR